MRPFAAIVLALIVIAGGIWWRFGTIEPCGIVRERLREAATQNGSDFGGLLASAMPDSVLNAFIAARYGSATPGRCLAALIGATGNESVSAASAVPSQRGLVSQQDRSSFITSAKQSCIAQEINDPSMKQSGYTEAQIGLYCQCAAKKAGDAITADEMHYIATNHAIPASFKDKTREIAQACRSATLSGIR